MTARTVQWSRLATKRPSSAAVGAVVVAGDDAVADPGPVPVGQGDGDGVVDGAGGDEVVADPAGQAGGGVVGVGQQVTVEAAGPVGHGRGEGGVFHVGAVPPVIRPRRS